MKKSRLSILSLGFLASILLVAVSCSQPSIKQTPDKDNATPTDTCTGDSCTAPSDAANQGDVLVDEARPEDQVQPEEKSCEDVCSEGMIKCNGDDRYNECIEKNGCWVWDLTNVECKGASLCACKDEDPAECTVNAGDECVCTPDCDGKECGADGCGGKCGECDEGSSCDPFKFICALDDCALCESFCQEGDTICNGEKVSYCIDVNADKQGCVECWKFDEDAEPCPGNQTCDSDSDKCVCDGGVAACGEVCCDDGEVCNSGKECCAPDCDGKVCGGDGCGGSCGTCAEAEFCNGGVCETKCVSDCDYGGETKCDGKFGYTSCDLVPGQADCYKEAGPFGCGESEECVGGECQCIPSCGTKVCGDDGCGGSCGQCDALNFEVCSPAGKCVCDCAGQPTGTMCDLATQTEYASNCLATCAGATNLKKGPCPKCQDDCTEDELAPMQICGFDMATYPNFCDLKCKIGGPDCKAFGNCPQILYPGACKPDCCEDKGCPADYNPLCGGDGVTYCNKCAIQQCGGGTEIACVGACPDAVACPDCAAECDPVCGLHNGEKKNFGSACMMECAGGELLWNGECCLHCDENEEWVCAAEGETYQAHINDCFQNCQAPEQVNLYQIPLLPNGEVWFDLCEECKCDISEAAPVCGDNYFTYTNACALDCAANANPDNPDVGAVPICDGECFTDDCPCPPETMGLAVPGQLGGDGIRGVCGADGNTYGNECHAAKYGTFVVSQIWCGTCAAVCAGDAYLPVCCDGVTYPSSCVADKCNDELDPGVSCFKGKCCLVDLDCDDGNEGTTDSCNNGVCENI
jgi:hypothetical protein